MRTSKVCCALTILVLTMTLACSQPAEQPNAAASGGGKAAAPAPKAAAVQVPAGTVVTVRLGNAVGSKMSKSGDEFTATVAEPIEVGGKVVAAAGAAAKGVVAEAVPLGRFKGGAKLQLTLTSLTLDGDPYAIEASSVTRTEKGKGKRTATMIGGGAGLGAIIGGIAGGGKGAAIGAAAGAGAGTAGAAFTGNKEIVLPAETALSFKLAQPVDVKR